MRHPRAARQPALQPAQQDPRDVAPDRGLPTRSRPARASDPPLGRVRRRRRALHRLPLGARSPARSTSTFGDVSMGMRNLLRPHGRQNASNAGTAASMWFLNATRPETIRVARKVMIDWGYKGAAPRPPGASRAGEATQVAAPGDHRQAAGARAGGALRQPPHAGGCRRRPRALLDIEDRDYVPVIRDPEADHARGRGGVLLPGCGSERLFSQVGLATRRCCGTSAYRPCCRRDISAAATRSAARATSPRPRRSSPTTACCSIASRTLNYLDIKTVVVSCGTCYDQLQGYRVRQDLPGLPDHRHPRVPDGEGRAAEA